MYSKVRMVNFIHEFLGVTCFNFQKINSFLSLKIDFVFANSADSDENEGFHCTLLRLESVLFIELH